MASTQDTIVALATPLGTAALATIRVSGALSVALAQAIFARPPHPRFARHAVYRDAGNQALDEVVYILYQTPSSYTGEDMLEITSHGNPYVAQKIIEDLVARGCRLAEPGEFTRRAFLGGKIDLSQAEAVMDVIHARSERALVQAQRLLRGELGRRMQGLVDGLVDVLAGIEAYIDFPEEDLPAENRAHAEKAVEDVLRGTSQLLATSHYGELLREGIKTVIVGEPNAGKSSLLNRLLGQERALVSPEPGTTRDFIEEKLLLGGHCLRLVDTAGLNPHPQAIERLGMGKTLEQVQAADLTLVVIDALRVQQPLPDAVRACLRAERTLVVINKVDLLPENMDALIVPREVEGFPWVAVSAQTGGGLEALREKLVWMVGSMQYSLGPEDIAINARHAQALSQARTALGAARVSLRTRRPAELVASDLREALAALGEISGQVDNEQVLDRLFASFCIGK